MASTPLLFLIADTGGGHRASANAVASRLATAYPGRFDPHIVDPFAEASPWLVSRTADLYEPIVRHVPWFWGALYHTTNSRRAVGLLRRAALRMVEPGLRKLLRENSYAAVVSFHPLLNDPADRALGSWGGPRLPFVTVITDLVDVHASWTFAAVDAIVTGSETAERSCHLAGIPPERTHHLGLAVDSRFTEAREEEDRAALRRSLGIRPEAFSVILCGGAVGSGGLVRQARALAASGADIDLVVICGRNAGALHALTGLSDAAGRAVPVLGFVENMPDWLRASDLLVTKAGPGAIAEALCTGIPLLLSSYLPGQEAGNVGWVTESGVGRYVPRLNELVQAVRELSRPGSPEIERMRRAVCLAARPQATERIADLVVRFAGNGR